MRWVPRRLRDGGDVDDRVGPGDDGEGGARVGQVGHLVAARHDLARVEHGPHEVDPEHLVPGLDEPPDGGAPDLAA